MGSAGFYRGDPIASMILEAVATGVTDFADAELLCPRWRRRFAALLRGIGLQHRQARADRDHRHQCAVLGCSQLSSQSIESTLKLIEKAKRHADYAIYWDGERIIAKQEREDARAAIGEWEKHFGSMSDPDVQRRISDTASALDKLRHDTAEAKR